MRRRSVKSNYIHERIQLPDENNASGLETAASLALPVIWTPVITNTANGTNGILKFTFSTGSGWGCLRTRYLP